MNKDGKPMTTITRFTKEQLITRVREKVKSLEFAVTQSAFADNRSELEEELDLARISLASLEAEPVAWIVHSRGGDQLTTDANYVANAEGMGGIHSTPVYAAPPAPVVPPEQNWEELCRQHPDMSIGDAIIRAAWWNLCRAAMIQGKSEPVSNRDELPEEKGASLQLRNLIRQRHAEWSDKTFGNVGPVGPLKHLSKEAQEAAVEPDDLSEWADMQFLLWDAQRRAGISDGEITAAMEEKLQVNMARQWPEPIDGEPRLHIKADQQQEHM